jgi:hypothetical protein
MEKHEMAQMMEQMLARIDANTKTMQENRGKGVGTDDIWPHSAARRRNRNGPRGRMGAEGTWSLPAEGRPAVQQ